MFGLGTNRESDRIPQIVVVYSTQAHNCLGDFENEMRTFRFVDRKIRATEIKMKMPHTLLNGPDHIRREIAHVAV